MTVPTAEQLSRLRQRPHRTTVHLSVYEPNTVLAARISMPSISRGERQIDISILGGDFNSVERGQTVYIGTIPNARGIGRLRAISATSTQLTLAENDLNLRDGMYLTVVAYYEPWAVYPRIVLDDDFVPTFYKDYDITYADQNENFDPVVRMGPNHAMFLDNTATGTWASIYYDSSGTFDPSDNSTPTGFAWVFEGGMPSASFVPDPGYIDYTGAGHFLTTLEVVSNRGKTFTGHRHVSVYTHPDRGPAPPIVAWGMQSFDGSRENGGYALRLWVREQADYQRVIPGSLVVLFTEDGEGSFEGKAGGNAENRSSILFNGYIEDGSIALNPVTNRLEFRVNSVTGAMKSLASFSVSLESVESPATWNEMVNLNVDKAMIHYLRWHSTILTIADFHPTGNFLNTEFMDFERANLYDAVNNLYGSALVATAVADRQGAVWAEIDASVRPTGSTRNLPTALSLTRQDWRGGLGFQEQIDERLSYIELGGLSYSGPATGTGDPYLAGAPGDSPAYHGSLERVSGLVVESQTQINELAGLVFARANARYPELSVPMGGDYRILDIAPQERVLVTLAEEDTYRGIAWDLKPFIPHQIRYQYEAADQVLLMEATLSEETDGPPGESVEIPVDPPFPLWIAPEIDLPPLNLPPPLDPIPIDPAPGEGGLVYIVTSNRLTRTRNMNDIGDLTTFEDLTPTFAGEGVTGGFTHFRLDPLDPQNVAYLVTAAGTSGIHQGPHVYKVTALDSANPVYTEILTPEQFSALAGSDSNQLPLDLRVSPIQNSIIDFYGMGHIPAPTNSDRGRRLRSIDGGASWFSTTGDHSREPGQNTENKIWTSEHSVVKLFFDNGDQGAGQKDWFYSENQGVHWAGILDNTNDVVQGFHVPYQANGDDRILYWSQIIGTGKELYYTNDLNSTRVKISPSFDGDEWAKKRYASRLYVSEQFLTWHGNRLYAAAILQRAVNEASDGNDSCYFTATDGGVTSASWTARRVFQGQVGFLAWHQTNQNALYALGNSDNERILVTFDGGLNWVDKQVSWERDIGTIGAPDSLGFTRVGIHPVWTV